MSTYKLPYFLYFAALGGLVVSVLATGLAAAGSGPAEEGK
jgi:hypothetical protein